MSGSNASTREEKLTTRSSFIGPCLLSTCIKSNPHEKHTQTNAMMSDVFANTLITLLYCCIASRKGFSLARNLCFFESCCFCCTAPRAFWRSNSVVISMSNSSFEVRPDLDLKASMASRKLDRERSGPLVIARCSRRDRGLRFLTGYRI